MNSRPDIVRWNNRARPWFLQNSNVTKYILTSPPFSSIQFPRFCSIYLDNQPTILFTSEAKSSLWAQYTTSVAPKARKATIRPQFCPDWNISSAMPTNVEYVVVWVRLSRSHIESKSCLLASINSSATLLKYNAAWDGFEGSPKPSKNTSFWRSL